MNYHNILHDDMRNGDGLRVTLFVSGCDNKCYQCQNPQTWDTKSGIEFDDDAKNEIFTELAKDHISGITISGGDPMHEENVKAIIHLLMEIRKRFGTTKTIWMYTGYTYEFILDDDISKAAISRCIILTLIDVLVDGKFEYTKADVKYHWAGSTNQRVINVKESLKKGEVVLWTT